MALSGLRKIVASQAKFPIVISSRGIVSLKNPNYEAVERPAPFQQDKYDFVFPRLMERTTTRFDNNSKIVIVDGAHAVGKTDLAKNLAEEFGMLHMDFPSVEKTYINCYGEDLRNYAEHLSPMNQPYAEKQFFKNPTGPLEGDGDRYVFRLYIEKLRQYMYALKHLFNTGQGVVLEGSVYNDYAHFEAAYNQGWIDRTTRTFLRESRQWMLPELLRPHVIIYLDAPVDTVVKKVQDRGNEWDKDSPVWSNRQYLSDIYNENKRNFLKDAQKHSFVFVYDWSEPGDVDVVVEDIESLELDYGDEYSDQQGDWKKIRDERHHHAWRWRFCQQRHRNYLMAMAMGPTSFYYADHLWMDPHDVENYHEVFDRVDSMKFSAGHNPYMGENHVWKLRTDNFFQNENVTRAYPMIKPSINTFEHGWSTIK